MTSPVSVSSKSVIVSVSPPFRLITNVSASLPPVSWSFPAPPVRVSSPAFPLRTSLPALPRMSSSWSLWP
ncbi:MAG: hypothetical protein CL610_19015 [Anaerolineaceae bacterium]|nr:hypothetical protein [Anaerolineaceae bacterium]